jgi:MFS family permease
MFRRELFNKIGSSPKIIAVSIGLISNAFIWYFYAFDFLLNNLLNTSAQYTLAILGLNFLGIVVSALSSTFIINKYHSRIRFLFLWTIAGILLSFIPLIIDTLPFAGLLAVSLIFGLYFGIGMPICMGYFAAVTKNDNRARLGGVVFLSIGIGFFLISRVEYTDALLTSVILGVWRIIGLVPFALKPEEKRVDAKEKISYSAILKDKPTLFYFVPWLMFLLINNLTFSINSNTFDPDLVRYSSMIENVLAGIFAVIFGFMADKVGRKRLAITGFVLLGLGYGVLAFLQDINANLGWTFYTITDGVAWGAFYTIFLVAIWGDLAKEKSSEKFYAIGSLPYLLTNFMRFAIGSYLGNTIIAITLVFSFASFFLFLAILPLIYAPETLSEKVIKDNDLKNYIENAKKKAQKDSEKAHKKEEITANEKEEKLEQDSSYEEAKKLAEKYY